MAIGMTLAFFKRIHKNLRIRNKKAIGQILKNDYTENWVKRTIWEGMEGKQKETSNWCGISGLLCGIIKITVL